MVNNCNLFYPCQTNLNFKLFINCNINCLVIKFINYHHIPSLFLGAHFMISSTLRIISAASDAELRACSLTLKHSVIPIASIWSIFPLVMLRPAVRFPLEISLLKFWTSSALSYPPLSQMMVGNYLRAVAKDSMAKAYFPLTVLAKSWIARDILISEFPPP